MIHIYGGIGCIGERDAHLQFKRAQAEQIMLGNAGEHGGLLAERLDIQSPETCGGASGTGTVTELPAG